VTNEEHPSDREDANQEGLIFSKITRYIAEQMQKEIEAGAHSEGTSESMPEEMGEAVTLFREIADAFELAGGIKFEAEQALPLSQAFALLATGMRALSVQATEQKQTNAAAKMEWAARKATVFTATFQQCHLEGNGGEISLGASIETSIG
jgi:hypothetical protein